MDEVREPLMIGVAEAKLHDAQAGAGMRRSNAVRCVARGGAIEAPSDAVDETRPRALSAFKGRTTGGTAQFDRAQKGIMHISPSFVFKEPIVQGFPPQFALKELACSRVRAISNATSIPARMK